MAVDPGIGRERGGERVVLVLSTRRFSEVTRIALIAPVSETSHDWPFGIVIGPHPRVAGAVLTDQTRSVDFAARGARFLGRAPAALTAEVLARVASIIEA